MQTILALKSPDKQAIRLEASPPTIAPVPSCIEIAPNRWHICIAEGEQRWTLPIQFTEIEARSLLPRLRGEPFEQATAIVREMCDRGGAS